MAHVRKQVRDAVIARLKTEFGNEFVGDVARLLRNIQTRQLPFVVVAVTDAVTSTDNNPPGERVHRRDFTVAIRACVAEDDEEALDTLDAVGVRIEKALHDNSELGVARLANWQLGGTGGPDMQPLEDGTLIATTTTYTASMLTLDADPENSN